ncbi:PAS domain S-box protein [Polaromonas sp. CG_9.11]|uniref:PAS domain S-box protein n=1 Tax=Polaromonas sp. CG_9.11 TaxID=2787730 RepID=UPI0018CB8FBF|nr:PAS domain S-box protein [Polaromonas sp. CG_9.11]MBG6074674.1 PAS domain S-box-containing protein [Polaromonas sp. CG_9.11]
MTLEGEPMGPSITASLLAGVLESAMDAIITVNAQQKIILFNQSAEKMFGWPRQEVLQQPFDRLMPGRFRRNVGLLAQFGTTGTTSRRRGRLGTVMYGLKANGDEFPIEVSISQVDTPEGTLYTAMVRDITELHASQAQLRLLEASIAHLNDVVVITEADQVDEPGPRIVFVNAAFERQTGYSREEVIGKTPRLLQGPLTQRTELDRIGTALRTWQPVRAELINYTKSGEAFWVEIDIVPIADAKGGFTHFVSVQRDVTERKRAEQALVDSERRYATLFSSAPLPMWVFDQADGQLLKVNQAAIEDYGYSEAECMTMTLSDIHSGTEPVCRPQDSAGAAQKRQGPYPHRRKDGSLFFVDVVARPIQFDGQPACFLVALDTTARVKAEDEVREHLFTLQRAADAAQAITVHLTIDGMVQELADQARGVIGAHQAAVSLAVDGNWAQAVHALSLSGDYLPDRSQLPLAHGSGIYTRGANHTRLVRLTQAEVQAHPDWCRVGSPAGRNRMMRGWLAVPLTGRDGRLIGVLQLSGKYAGDFTQQDEYVATEMAQLSCIAVENAGLLQEVSQLNTGLEKKVAERTAALAHQEALFRALAGQAPQIIWTAEPSGDVTYLNQAWFDLMGRTLQNWTGWQWLAALHPEDIAGVKQNWTLASAGNLPFSGIRRWLCQDGSVHTMAYRASPVLDAQGRVAFWVGIDADVTEFKLIEAALRRSNEELEAFSYSVSHDLRAPLSTINGFGALLARQLTGDGNEKVRHYLARIQHGVAQMGSLIEDLLSLARVTRTRLCYQQVDLSAMARRILDDWRVRQPARVVSTQVEAGLLAHADEALLRVVMENLLGNAWKFSVRQAEARISVGQQLDAAGQPVFFVRDNGAGFDMAHAEKLFLPFERLHTPSEFPGSGIGLATVSRVIGHHGGRLWADATPGLGATFYFTLPRPALTA